MVNVLNICSKKFGFVANSMSCHDVCYGLVWGTVERERDIRLIVILGNWTMEYRKGVLS